MNSKDTRQKFFDFFKSKGHEIVPSAPIVVKDDPTLMFTNAGMNQFKDIFLGNQAAVSQRVADTQKCLRVSGKHNDLEEVGLDTYHHTMFEMLGNWSFGDYFKKEAIDWAWELLVEVYGISKNNLYATYFGGDASENMGADEEAKQYWLKYLPTERVLPGSKKDNFWEMGDTGPCGPCSEIHVDLRKEEDKANKPGYELVNTGHPLVIEIWNLVFIEFQRLSNGTLQNLPMKHVDTGMGFERLCMALQGKTSNYDTDVFQTLITKISELSGIKYGIIEKQDIAMRVIADHIRAVAFSIADGQLPSNNKAGYVIRRILRRAVRYGYTFLNFREPFMFELVPMLAEQMGEVFPGLKAQQELVRKVITEEEQTFLKTLSSGIHRFEAYVAGNKNISVIDGKFAFELFDTYGFPVDLTQLIARESGLEVDMDGFIQNMEEQKMRSRRDAQVEAFDWIEISPVSDCHFVGYEELETEIKIIRYRKIIAKGNEMYQLVFNRTPFYAESGGQVGDSGYIEAGGFKTIITDTRKENNLSVHIADKLPLNPDAVFKAVVNVERRLKITNNHTATHLMHYALRQVLGSHIEQKGSHVDSERLRFDFSHFQKMSQEEISGVETIVNKLIRKNIKMSEFRDVPMDEAVNMGAMALFGEKYGDKVRVIKFDDSIELCGGVHVPMTGQIGLFRIISESAIAAGIRRIEAITGEQADEYVSSKIELLNEISSLLKNSADPLRSINNMNSEIAALSKEIEEFKKEKTLTMIPDLAGKMTDLKSVQFLAERIDSAPETIKDIAYGFKNNYSNFILVIGSLNDDKPMLTVMISDDIMNRGIDASAIVRILAKEINGGGGGQKFYAVAGGKNPSGLDKALAIAREVIEKML